MSFEEHPEFNPPKHRQAQIWRYMDITKFLSLLEKSALYFARIDQLGEFDPFEGYYTNLDVFFDNVPFEAMPDEWKERTGVNTPEIYNSIVQSNKRSRELVKYHRAVTFANSWHAMEYESAAMWKLYLSSHEGIAIQSTYERLIESMEGYKDFDVKVGMIKYIDYKKETIPMGNLLSPFLHKRKSFEHEQELRALIWTPEHGKNDLVNPDNNKFKNIYGLYITVNLETLIDKIYVAPNAPRWIIELISAIVEKFELKKEVIHSDLATTPIY